MLIFPAYATTNHTVHEIIVKIERMVVWLRVKLLNINSVMPFFKKSQWQIDKIHCSNFWIFLLLLCDFIHIYAKVSSYKFSVKFL
jgi:uncharacterized membrane protein